MNNYLPFFKCRNSTGGGVGLLVKEDVECEEIFLPHRFREEIIGVMLKIKSKTVAVFSYYNPPKELLNRELFSHIEQLFQDYLIMGDLNAIMTGPNCKTNQNGRKLEEILMNHSCMVLNENKKPTSYRFMPTGDAHAVIDYFIGSSQIANKMGSYIVLYNTILTAHEACYYHVPIQMTISIEKDKPQSSTNESYLYTRADVLKFSY